jgi:hypothetical protein
MTNSVFSHCGLVASAAPRDAVGVQVPNAMLEPFPGTGITRHG